MAAPMLVPLCAVLGFLLPAAYGLLNGIPEPLVHDEFAYLLGADTFARGRLTNPPPEFPRFFESEHILVTPTYQSKYPPAQSLMLAAGQSVFGHPIWGVWLSCGLFAGSLVWMLQAWTSRHWALTTTVLAVLTIGTTGYWAQSYWGGALGATGGALLFGSLRRILAASAVRHSVSLGLALILLANTRPFEGFLAAIPGGLLLARRLFVGDGSYAMLNRLAIVVLPVTVVVTLGFVSMGIYSRAVTGVVLKSPYQLHIEQYLHRGVFIFSGWRVPERTPSERVDHFYRDLAGEPVQGTDILRRAASVFVGRLLLSIGAPLGLVTSPSTDAAGYCGVLLWLLVLPPMWVRRPLPVFAALAVFVVSIELLLWRVLPLYPWSLMPVGFSALLVALDVRLPRGRWWHVAGCTVLLEMAVQALVQWWLPHYVAPIYALVFAAMATGLRRYSARLRAPARRTLYPVLATLSVVHIAAVMVSGTLLRIPLEQSVREEVKRGLLARGGSHIVFVVYAPGYNSDREWVYNDADLPNSPVLFAHSLGDSENRRLIGSMPARTAWTLMVRTGEATLMRY